jgi:ATP-binding cassette subfamily B protein
MKRWATLTPYFRRHWGRVLWGLLALLVVDGFQLFIPRVVKNGVDRLSDGTATADHLLRLGLVIVALAVGIGALRYAWRVLILGFSRIVEEDLRNRMMERLLGLPPAWYLTRTTGDIMAKATNDLEALRMAAGMGLVALVDSILMGAASFGFMVWIHPTLTLLALLPMPIITLVTRRLGTVMFRRYRQVQDTFGRMSDQVREHLAGIRVIQAAVREDLVLGDLDRLGRVYVTQNVRLSRVSGSMFPMLTMVANVSLAIVLYFGGRLTILNEISPGDFVAFISYLGLMAWPMMALGWVMNMMQRGAAALARLDEILLARPEIRDPEAPLDPPAFQGRVDIRNLTFLYPGRTEPALADVSLSFPAGRFTALVGRTGSGKTTLVNLIPRLFDPPAGTVFIDGVDVTRLKLKDLRSAIGYVPQDGYVFSGSVYNNIAFGRPAADPRDVEAAARAVRIHDEVAAFPQGYQTLVGERGLTLSGGQRQRLALARALLVDPPLLILDDPFSSLDASVEERILDHLAESRAGKTTIIISHRLTSLRPAAVIHVLDMGRLTQSGAHDELMRAEGYFAHLALLQNAGPIDDLEAVSTGPAAPLEPVG